MFLSHEFNFFNPKAGLFYQFNNNNQAYASVAIANREPSRGNYRDADLDYQPKPERLYDFELGYHHINTRFSASANLYFMNYKDQLVALDLAGDEVNFPGKLFIDHFREGRDAGWHITVHAGEEVGPDSIWQAVEELHAERVGHGVSAAKDHKLMDFLIDREIGIESNLTSNLQTRVIDDYSAHPLKEFLEAGILATINSDDPGISAIDLKYEYEHAAPAAGLSPELIRKAQQNSLEIAFLDPDEKISLQEKAAGRVNKSDE